MFPFRPLLTSIFTAGAVLIFPCFSPAKVWDSSFVIESESKQSSFSLKINVEDSWKIESHANWLDFSTTSGEGKKTVTVTLDENPFPGERVASVHLAGRPFLFTQEGGSSAGESSSLSSKSKSVSYKSGSYSFTSKSEKTSFASDYRDNFLSEFPDFDAENPPYIILDTDAAYDSDDFGTLAAAYALNEAGLIRLLAVIGNANYESAKVGDAFNRFWDEDIPLGTLDPYRSDAWGGGSPGFGPSSLQNEATKNASSSTSHHFPATDLYSDLVAKYPDKITIVSIGFLNNLSQWINTSEGKSLAKKVKNLIIMGGKYPHGGKEHNIGGADPAGWPGDASNVLSNWPGSVNLIGTEAGIQVLTGCEHSQQDSNNPMRLGYEAHMNRGGNGVAPCNFSPDQLALFHAVLPSSKRPWHLSDPVDVWFDYGNTSGASGNSSSNKRYLIINDSGWAANIIDSWQMVEPNDGGLKLNKSSSSGSSKPKVGSLPSWLEVKVSTDDDDYKVTIKYDENKGGAGRQVRIKIGDQIHTITQDSKN